MMAISWVCVTSTTRWIRQFAISTRVVMQGRNIGDLLSEAMLAYLARVSVSRGRSTLRALAPEPFPDGNEGLSREIDAIVYHCCPKQDRIVMSVVETEGRSEERS